MSRKILLSFRDRVQMRLRKLLKELGAPEPWSDEWKKWSAENANDIVNAYSEAEKWAELNPNIRR